MKRLNLNINGAKRGLPYPTKDLQVIVYNQTYEDGGTTYLRTSTGIGIPKVSGTGLDAIWDFSVLNDERFDKSNATYWGDSLDEYFYYNELRPYDAKLKDFHYKFLNEQVTFDNTCFLKAQATTETSNVIDNIDVLLIYSLSLIDNDLIKVKTYCDIQSFEEELNLNSECESLLNMFDFRMDAEYLETYESKTNVIKFTATGTSNCYFAFEKLNALSSGDIIKIQLSVFFGSGNILSDGMYIRDASNGEIFYRESVSLGEWVDIEVLDYEVQNNGGNVFYPYIYPDVSQLNTIGDVVYVNHYRVLKQYVDFYQKKN